VYKYRASPIVRLIDFIIQCTIPKDSFLKLTLHTNRFTPEFRGAEWEESHALIQMLHVKITFVEMRCSNRRFLCMIT
jgi:hypothetical protein